MSNLGLNVALRELGIAHVQTKVGDRNVLEEMQGRGAVVGGEDCGHIFFLDHHATGDGIITALQILRVMCEKDKPLSELAVMARFPQTLVNITIRSKPDLEAIPEVVAAVRQAESALGERGRVLVRYSGTQRMCRVMVEGPTLEETEKYSAMIAAAVRKKLA